MSPDYDEREFEQFLEDSVARGAKYERMREGVGRYRMTIPPNNEFTVFYKALRECPSIAEVDSFIGFSYESS